MKKMNKKICNIFVVGPFVCFRVSVLILPFTRLVLLLLFFSFFIAERTMHDVEKMNETGGNAKGF